MKSIKRGRAPSIREGIAGIGMGIFGVFWCVMAAGMGAPPLFVGFGVIFILIAVANAVYSLSNATRKNRYSEYDITGTDEETDPLNARFGGAEQAAARCVHCGATLAVDDRFCPGCGSRVYPQERRVCPDCGKVLAADDRFCGGCGRKID